MCVAIIFVSIRVTFTPSTQRSVHLLARLPRQQQQSTSVTMDKLARPSNSSGTAGSILLELQTVRLIVQHAGIDPSATQAANNLFIVFPIDSFLRLWRGAHAMVYVE